ncbi:lipopolysaccharide biosynthesis protein [Tabrizicola sp.]|uniref:lipopolysaccharide biosynthesis protein n=1 Tax=Tabrizicola sp. TaxID=2005166 RepID=UPI002604F680|nr:lipopolysaccharide biosynthesis protein [Tabrizicola sp.]MDM7932742.1 lipopolysaccharide biosynthesis protein [Tabrizicola sp.]
MSADVGDTRSDPAAAVPRMHQHVSEGRGRRAVLGVGWSALNTGSAMLIAMIVFVITSRLLGPDEFGIVAFALSIIAIVGCATPGGFGEAIIQRTEIADDHLDTVFWLCIISGLVMFVLILLLAGTVAEISGEPVMALLLPFFGVKLVLDLAAVVPQALVIRAMRFKHVAARTAIGNSVGGVICVAMALNGYGLWALAMAPMVTSVVSLIILAWAARWWPGFGLRISALRDLLRFGLFASGNNALYFLNLDRLLLGFLAGPAVLGLYFLGRRLFDLLSGVTAGAILPVTNVFFASIQNEPGKQIGAYSNAIRATTLAVFPLFGGLYALADSAVPMIFGSHWDPAMPAVKAFAIIGLMGGLFVPSSSLAIGLGRADMWFVVDLLRQILVVSAILLFVSSGLEAVMTSLVVVNAAMLPACFLIARRLIQMPLRQYLEALMLPLLATGVMCGAIVALPWLLPALRPTVVLATQMVVGASVYLGIVLSMSRQQIAELRQAFSRGAAGD